MTSLRRTILFWMAALLFVVGTASAIATFAYVKDEAQSFFDAEIRQIAQFLQTNKASASGQIAPNPEDLFLIQVWDDKGRLLRSSNTAAEATAPIQIGFADETLGGSTWRSFTAQTLEQTIRVALPLDERNEQASTAALQIAIPMAVIIPLSWLLLSFIIDRLFARLDQVAAGLRARKTDDASPIAGEDLPLEVQPFVGSINGLVARMQGAVERQKRFVSDAAHELRTPLTALSIQLGNLRNVTSGKEELKRLAAAEAGSKRANALVSRLLHIARLDAGAPLQDNEPAQIGTVLNQAIAGVAAQATERKMKVKLDCGENCSLSVPRHDLLQVCEVVLENAIRYAPAGSKVSVAASVQNSEFKISVSDAGPGIPEDKLSKVFDRFYRAAPHAAAGTGLGLAIAKAICDARGWSILLSNRKKRTGIEALIIGKVGQG